MNNSKNGLKSYIFGFLPILLITYQIGVAPATIYFTVKNIQKTESTWKAVILAPILGTLEGMVWPYFAVKPLFTNEVDKVEVAELPDSSVTNFIFAALSMNEFKRVSSASVIHGDVRLAQAKGKYWIGVILGFLEKCDVHTLDSHYPDWGKSLLLLKAGLEGQLNGDSNAIQLLDRFDTWTNLNKQGLSRVLNSVRYEAVKLPTSLKQNEPTSVDLEASNQPAVEI